MAHIHEVLATRYYMVHYCNVLCARTFSWTGNRKSWLNAFMEILLLFCLCQLLPEICSVIRTVIVLSLSGASTFKCSSGVVFILHTANIGVFYISTDTNVEGESVRHLCHVVNVGNVARHFCEAL